MRFVLLALCIGVCCTCGHAFATGEESAPRHPEGVSRARVVIAEDRDAVNAFNPRPERVDALFNLGLLAFTGKPNREAAWKSLVSTQDIVGIKVLSGPGANSGTRPAVVAALVKGLLAAGQPPRHILIWDRHLSDLRRAGFVDLAAQLGVEAVGSAEEGYDEGVVYAAALLGKLVWGDLDFGKNTETAGRNSYVSRLITRKLTKIINVTPLLNHNLAGVSGNLYTLSLDSIDNWLRFEGSPEHLSQAVPEIYALEALGDKVILSIVDALVCQYQGEELSHLNYSTVLGQIRFSRDPVALDILSIAEIQSQRARKNIEAPPSNMNIYSNAALLQLGVNKTNLIDILRIQ